MLGAYAVTQTAVPLGYALDLAPTRAVTVSSAQPNAVIGVQNQNDPGTTDQSDFHSRIFGDTDLDGDVDFENMFTLTNYYGWDPIQNGRPATWAEGDFDGDGDVDFEDAFLAINNYGYGL